MKSSIKLLQAKELAEKAILQINFKHFIEDKQIVFGEVYAPNMVDTDWEAMTPEDTEYAAHNFMKNKYIDRIDINHNKKESGALVVESYIVRTPDDPFYNEGAWVMGVWVPDEVWKKVKTGELNAFSFYGFSEKQPVQVIVDVVTMAAGETEDGQDLEESVESHKHTYVIRLNEKGYVISGYTDFVHNHQHSIKLTSATEIAMDHAHRYFVE
jgi:hypothetical protein